jgi:glycosyltransferase involved in cell wall biosynthesis
MLLAFFADEELRRQYDISFSYRHSPQYDTGLRSRAPMLPAEVWPLRLLDFDTQIRPISWRPARILARAIGYGLLIRYWYIIWNTIVLYRSWRKRGIDLLHINNGGYPAAASCTSAVFAARLLGIGRILYFVNNTPAPYKSFFRWPDYLFDRLVARWVTLFITGSTYNAVALRRVLCLPLGKVANIPNGVAMANASKNPNSVRDGLGADGRCVVVVAAVLEERKGHVYLLRALDLMRRRGMQPLPLVIVVGGGAQEKFLQRFVDRASLQDSVRFVGPKERADCLDFIEASDVLVLPSVGNEDWPNAVLEAMSMGKPVIGTRVAGIPDQIEHGITGLLVAPRDAVGLADALQQLAENSVLRRSLGQAGAEKCRREFALTVVMNRYRDLYSDLFGPEEKQSQGVMRVRQE